MPRNQISFGILLSKSLPKHPSFLLLLLLLLFQMRAVNVSADYCYSYEELRYSSWKVGNFWSQKYNVSDAEKKNGTYNILGHILKNTRVSQKLMQC